MDNSKILPLLVIFIALSASTWWVKKQFAKPSVNQVMQLYVQNKQSYLPQSFEANSRIDSTSVDFNSGRYLIFHCTLKDSIELDQINLLKKYFEPRLLQYVCEASELTYFKSHKVSIRYIFNDLRPNHLFTCTFGISEYQ